MFEYNKEIEDFKFRANLQKKIKRYEFRKFKVEKPILDIGGGDGGFLISQGIKDATILDMDIPEKRLSCFNYIKQDITGKISLNKRYKTIFIMEVLEHIQNPLYLLAQVYDLLQDDGFCYVSIPYTGLNYSYTSSHKRNKKNFSDIFLKNKRNRNHVNRWRLNEFLEQADNLGFDAKVIQKRRRFKGLGVFIPHCWLVFRLTKRVDNQGHDHKKDK